jgi:hypothetical protein
MVTSIVEADGGTGRKGAIREEKVKSIGRTCHGAVVGVCEQRRGMLISGGGEAAE